jgi:hypothetical protein
MRRQLLIIVIVAMHSCIESDIDRIDAIPIYRLNATYSTRLAVSGDCEGITQSFSFNKDSSFTFNEYCNDNPKSAFKRKIGGTIQFVSDSIALLVGENASFKIRVLDSETISILHFRGEPRWYYDSSITLSKMK